LKPQSLKSPPFHLSSNPESQAAIEVAKRLQDAGFQAVIAGGAVRDLLLGIAPKDYDIATDAHPKEVLGLFKLTKKVGIAFGVVLVNDFKTTIEVATFRADLDYIDGRRPEGVVFTDAKNDAQRRDFTINGLFYDPIEHQLIDHVEGLQDLEQGTIRAIGEAPQRFSEDYLRMLRAIRFSVRFGFKIDPSTWEALQFFGKHLSQIAADRIHEELQKTLSYNKPDLCIQLLKESGLFDVILPNAYDKIQIPLPTCSENYASGGDLIGVLSLFLQHFDDKNQLNQFLENFRCTNPTKLEVGKLIRTLNKMSKYLDSDDANKKRLIRKHSPQHLLFILQRSIPHQHLLSTLESDLGKWGNNDLFPSFLPQGKELIKRGVKPGPEMGEILYKLETLALNHKLHHEQDVDDWLQEHLRIPDS
jgi:poly(A) polymerase